MSMNIIKWQGEEKVYFYIRTDVVYYDVAKKELHFSPSADLAVLKYSQDIRAFVEFIQTCRDHASGGVLPDTLYSVEIH